jgi:hypothetical protein
MFCLILHWVRMAEGFYVSVRDGKRTGFLLGPHCSSRDALAEVQRGKKLAEKADPFASFYDYGTCSVRAETLPKAVFS